MRVTIKGKRTTIKVNIEGPLKQKLAFLEALTGVAVETDAKPDETSKSAGENE